MESITFIGISTVVVLLSIFFIYSKRKKNRHAAMEEDDDDLPAQYPVLRNAIYIFGDFVAYDAQGNEIGFRFSTKLRSLFAAILFSSIGETFGISTAKLTSLLWPDRDVTEAKNIRGVTINHLRAALADIEGIALIHCNHRWHFAFSEPFYCDFIEVSNIINHPAFKNNDLSNKEISTLRNITRKGPIFPELRLDWLDHFKNDYENAMEERIVQMVKKLHKNGDHLSTIRLADVCFTIDPINEEVLALCIRSLKKTGKIKQAQFLYNKFCECYESSIGEPYTRNLLLSEK